LDYYSNKKVDGSNPSSEEKEEEKSGSEKRPMRYVFLLGILPMVKKLDCSDQSFKQLSHQIIYLSINSWINQVARFFTDTNFNSSFNFLLFS
jgi:hypothetical protein